MLGLLALGVAAVIARFSAVRDGLWYDEIASWMDYGAKGAGAAVGTWYDPANHVLQSLLSWASTSVFEASLGPELALRLPALLASLAAIVFVADLARVVWPDDAPPTSERDGGPDEADASPAPWIRRTPWIAAVLAAVCPVLALSGAEARGYAFMIAATACAHASLLRWRAGPGWASGAAYAAAMGLGAWAHPVTACTAIGHAVWALVDPGGKTPDDRARPSAVRRRVVALTPIVASGLVALALYAPILDDILRFRANFERTGADQPGVLGPEGIHLMRQLGGAWSGLGTLPGAIATAVGSILLWRAGGRPRAALALGAAGTIVFLALVLGADFWLYARFALIVVPAALLAQTACVRAAARRDARLGSAVLALILAGWAVDLARRPAKQPLRAAATWVLSARAEAMATEGDGAGSVHVIGLRHGVMDAYLGAIDPSFSPAHGQTLARDVADARPAWMVVLYPPLVPDETQAWLDREGYEEVARFDGWVDWTRGDVVVLRRARR